MFLETYVAKYRDWKAAEERGDHVEVVTNVARSILAPSESLAQEYSRLRAEHDKVQNDAVADWWNSVYLPSYLDKIRNSLSARQRIAWLGWKEYDLRKSDNDLWLVCYEGDKALQGTRYCHRFILLDILEGRIKL